MKSVFTRLNDEEYEKVVDYARKRKLSIYEAVRELIMLGISEHIFKEKLLKIIEVYARLDSSFRLRLEQLLTSIESEIF